MTFFPLATAPLTTAPGPSPQSSPFLALVQSQDEGQYLVEISAYKGGEPRSGGLWTLTEGPLASVPGGQGVDIGLVTFRYGDKHWVGDPDDADQPNMYYEGRARVPLVMERIMPVLPESARRVQRQFGLVEIANGDGALDAIVQSYAVNGRQVRVLFGPIGGAYSDFGVIADVLGTGWTGQEQTVQLGIRDQSFSLDLPLQTNLYAGTGGAEGTSESEGKPKPLAFGRIRNATPILIDPTNLIYQIHDGEIFAVDDVFDRGAALTDSLTDVSGYTNLVAQSVAAGNFATALDVGMFKLGSSPDGLITCDVRGDATPDYQNTLDTIALRILKDRVGLSATLINESTFAGVAAIAGELGIYISHNEAPTAAQVMDALIGAVGGWWGAARDGRIRAGRLVDPANRAINLYLDEFDILALEPEDVDIPRWRQKVAYQHNWTRQRGEDLAASVTDARRQFLTEEDRAVSASDTSVKVRHVLASDPPALQSLYESSSDADTLAAYLLGLHSPDRRIFRVTIKRRGYLVDFGSIVQIKYGRFGLSSGVKFSVIGIREDAERDETILRVWG